MPWFYVDDGFSNSKPVVNMPGRYRLAACGLWVLAGSWSAKEELDGFVPESQVRQLMADVPNRSRGPILAALTATPAPLCSNAVTPGAGLQLLHWPKWQPTRAETQSKRKANAARQARWRERNKQEPTPNHKGRNAIPSEDSEVLRSYGSVTPEPSNAVSNAAPTLPTPNSYLTDHPYQGDEEVLNQERSPNVLPPRVQPSASRLVKEIIPDTYPSAVRTALRIAASQLMNRDGLDADTVGHALRLWLAKPDAGPGLLPHLASQAMREGTSPLSPELLDELFPKEPQ